MSHPGARQANIKVVGVGGAGANAIARMGRSGVNGVELLALNTDVQALGRIKHATTFAIGPRTTGGMGSGGRPEIGRKAVKESQEQVAKLLEGSDMVFIAVGLGGGTGTGAAPIVADLAKRQGALTVGVATLPFSFEGSARKELAEQGMDQLRHRVDALIAVENDRLLPSLEGKVSLEKAFRLADEVLRQGIQGISDIITIPGLINVDFADVRSVMSNGGISFMAMGEGKGRLAAAEATHQALSNLLFDAALEGATGVLLNVKGGKDLALGQVHEVAEVIRAATRCDANVVFGVVQDGKLGGRVVITLVATGIEPSSQRMQAPKAAHDGKALDAPDVLNLAPTPPTNGRPAHGVAATRKLV